MTLDLATVYIITAIAVTTLLELAGVMWIASIARESRMKTDADDAALYLQGRRVEEVLREMRAELLRR